MIVYAVIDTNVLVSAMYTSNEKAATARLIRALGNGNFRTLYNDEIIKEYQEVLHRAKFDFDSELAGMLIETVISNGIPANRIASGEQFPDPDDAVFYEVALSKEGAFVVIGNLKHFPHKPIVVTPAEMLEILGI